jgi:hypothetical protein
MPNSLFEKHFRITTPSKEIRDRHRDRFAAAYANGRQRTDQMYRAQRDVRAAYKSAIREILSKHGGLNLDALSKKTGADTVDFKSLTPSAKVQSAYSPRPRKAPPGGTVYSGWVAGDTNNSSFNDIDTINVEVFSGWGTEGGTDTVWGYAGQYYEAIAPSSPSEVSVSAASTLQISHGYRYTTTNYGFLSFDYAVVNLWVNMIILAYDQQWNLLQEFSSPQTSIDSVNTDSGSHNMSSWPGPIPLTAQTTMLSIGGIDVTDSTNLGIFVQFFATAFGWGFPNGDPEGWGVVGSAASGQVQGTIKSFTVTGTGPLIPPS